MFTEIPPHAEHFMSAPRFAVVGRVLEDDSRFDYKVLEWYTDRKLPVTGVRAPRDGYDNKKGVLGQKVVDDVTQLPDLANTSISVILHPALGIKMMHTLFPEPRRPEAEPHALWFQPGAESDEIWEFVKARGITDKVVLGDHACILVSGDDARKAPKAAL
ncbi:uncharacterized protein COLE_03537 [Cutaneotrichosporon oleaginosum]|uniref:uncharacterized protein n=1 Tax=Cutaneotrichosporon oleaginosum TaxID=879819 RepID=UPI00132A2AB6|nr:hypothetical protein COLE_03537 [Cutaneotrichosporon oleaginosum]